jgi:16S rRNA (guanine527-N7)-methyltransferase
VGSGAGLPGVPLAISRPDLDIVLLEPMARRVDWLAEVAEKLELPITIVRGRAEEREVREQLGGAEVVTARAVAPLARLAGWCLPLVRSEGVLLALKGMSAGEEIERDRDAVRRVGGGSPEIAECGAGVLEVPSIVVLIKRLPPKSARRRSKQI